MAEKPHDAVVIFKMHWNLERDLAVIPTIARHLFDSPSACPLKILMKIYSYIPQILQMHVPARGRTDDHARARASTCVVVRLRAYVSVALEWTEGGNDMHSRVVMTRSCMYEGQSCLTDVPGGAESQQLNPSHVLAHLSTPSSSGLRGCPASMATNARVLTLSWRWQHWLAARQQLFHRSHPTPSESTHRSGESPAAIHSTASIN